MTNNASKKIIPTRKWYGLSLFLFLLGPIISAYLLYSIFSAAVHTITFYVPGTSQLFIPTPGQYTLWVESKAPKNIQKLKNLGVTQITFTDTKTHESFLFKPTIGWSNTQNNSAHYSLGSLSFTNAGTYQVTALMPDNVPRYRIYLRQPSLLKVLAALAASFFFTGLGIASALLSAIIILIKRMNAQKTMKTDEQKPTPTLTQQAPTTQETTWAMVCHLCGFAGFIFPFGNLIAPLVVWAMKREKMPYVDEQGKEAVNFQLSITIYYIIALVLMLIVIGLFLLPVIAVFHIIAMVMASIETANGKPFRYPLTMRFIR